MKAVVGLTLAVNYALGELEPAGYHVFNMLVHVLAALSLYGLVRVTLESPRPGAFDDNDLQFLELFSREVAMALNTLELLQAQLANTAQRSVEAIHSAVALPVDHILNDAVNVITILN